jgi:chromosomal replication initiation ATPase DnaA
MAQIAQAVSLAHGITVADLRGPSRLKPVSEARQEFMALAMGEGRFSSPQVGRWLNRDHSTVLHGVKRHWAREEKALG